MLEGRLRYVSPEMATAPFGNKFFQFYQMQNLGGEKLSQKLGIPHSDDKPIPQDQSIKGNSSDPNNTQCLD
jgi:hypothetical protein